MGTVNLDHLGGAEVGNEMGGNAIMISYYIALDSGLGVASSPPSQ